MTSSGRSSRGRERKVGGEGFGGTNPTTHFPLGLQHLYDSTLEKKEHVLSWLLINVLTEER